MSGLITEARHEAIQNTVICGKFVLHAYLGTSAHFLSGGHTQSGRS
jgi:hypothetical protein